MTNIIERGGRFIVRQTKDRRLKKERADEGPQRLEELLAQAHPVRAVRAVNFETVITSNGRRRRKQARVGRSTTLEIRAVSTCFRRPDLSRSKAKELSVNVVHVREVDTPEGIEPIEWRLLTTEPIQTEQDVLRVVDAYRTRWLIEEYFKAIKTGCRYEKLQLESLHALKIALSLCLAIAWHMLLLRTLARDKPDVSAAAVMTRPQFLLLMTIAATNDNPWSVRIPEAPTVTDIMYAVARMGGHLRHNGPPGWQTLARGFQELSRLLLVQEFLETRSDQS
jgi:hypothetical protein